MRKAAAGTWIRHVLCLGAALPLAAVAQEPAAAAGKASGIPFETAVDIAVNGVYGLLGLLSILTLALIIYFIAVLRKGQVVPELLRRELMEKLQSGNLEDARRLCSFRSGALSAVVLSALEHLKNIPDADAMLLRDVVEAEGARQAESIEGQPQLLMDIAVVAPMIGLLGTVFGMMIAFNAVSDQIAVVRPTALVAGVNKAMITTAFGLVVGIPAMMFYAYFRRRASRLISMLEVASGELVMILLSRRPKA
jgi:biopolymer transport protein ExbB